MTMRCAGQTTGNMEKAITQVKKEDIPENFGEDAIAWDCDFEKFRPLVHQMNKMGAPVTLYDLMKLIEGKLVGKIISGTEDPHKRYTLYHNPNKSIV